MAQAVHGISWAEIQQGRSAHEVAGALNALLAGDTVYCDGFEWDNFWCARLFEATELSPAFILKDLYELLEPEAMVSRFREEKHRLSSNGTYQAHRALDDAHIIYSALDTAILGDEAFDLALGKLL